MGNSFDNEEDTPVTTLYTYDRNGNQKTMTTLDNVTTTYYYDKLDRQTGTDIPDWMKPARRLKSSGPPN